ncbi:MAG TPA: phospholipase D family protein [Gaiellaceae bacterium]|nr:phospholipase D family protein [Gaiellaceae bacterium]
MRGHHRRRLSRIGHERVLDASESGWAETATFPARAGNRVELLVDGSAALPRIAADVEAARSHVHLAGWFFTPGLTLGESGPTLAELLGETAERVPVRVLAWAGAPLPLFHPDRGEVREMRDRLVHGTRIEVALDAKERPMHCHHEKLVLVDDRVAYVGGIDLTSFSGDRLDGPDHDPRGRIGWHDACVRLEGPIVADVAEHIRLRWEAVTGTDVGVEGSDPVDGGVQAQLVRTVPEKVYPALRAGEFTILESYLRALRSAERLVYLESQFLWSSEVVTVLADKLRDPPCDDFRVVVLLPARPNNGGDDTRGQVGVLLDADEEGGGVSRFLACTLYQPGRGGSIVYVHAKIGIVDDGWLTIGSANLNEHSLFNDTEVNVVVHDEATVRAMRLQLWSEHLERSVDDVAGDATALVDEVWRPRAEEELERRRRDGYVRHRLTLLPHVSRRAQAMWGPISGLLVDG